MYLGRATVSLTVLALAGYMPGPVASLINSGKEEKEDPELRLARAQLGLQAARMRRAIAIHEAEIAGKDVRTDLEKSREMLLLTRFKLGVSTEVTSRTDSVRLVAKVLEERNRRGLSDVEKERRAKLSASKEMADFRAARERFLELAKEREKAIAKAKEAGADIRTDLEKAAEALNLALAAAPGYEAALKRWRAALGDEPMPPLEAASDVPAPLRALLLRVEMAGK